MRVKEILISAPPILVPIVRKHHAFTASWVLSAYDIEVYPIEWLYTNSNRIWWVQINNFHANIIWENNAVWRIDGYKGLHTDFASCPDALQSFVATADERFFMAPLFHDIAYQTKDITRADADEMMAEVAHYYGYKGIKNFFASFGVSVGGSPHYNAFRERDKRRCGRITKLGFLQSDGSIRL